MRKKDARKISPQAQEALRIRIVDAVTNGMKQKDAARFFQVAVGTVNRYMRQFRKDGKNGLLSKKQGRPKGSGILKGWQAAQISKAIKDKCPDQLKMPFYLWTRDAVAELIKRRFNIKISIWSVGRYLSRWGFSPQKPIRRAYERDDQVVQKWIDAEYPKIKIQANLENAEIHWGDEMGMRSDHQAGRTWGLKGETPVVKISGKRFSCNMISSITNKGKLYFMVFEENFTVPVFLKFLKRLIKQSNQKIYLIVDGHPVHRAKKVKAWVDQHSEKLNLLRLPPYSPEINPDEYLNNDVKMNAVGRKRPENKNELKKNVRNYLRSTQKKPGKVKKFFSPKSVKFAS